MLDTFIKGRNLSHFWNGYELCHLQKLIYCHHSQAKFLRNHTTVFRREEPLATALSNCTVVKGFKIVCQPRDFLFLFFQLCVIFISFFLILINAFTNSEVEIKQEMNRTSYYFLCVLKSQGDAFKTLLKQIESHLRTCTDNGSGKFLWALWSLNSLKMPTVQKPLLSTEHIFGNTRFMI